MCVPGRGLLSHALSVLARSLFIGGSNLRGYSDFVRGDAGLRNASCPPQERRLVDIVSAAPKASVTS